MKRTAYNTIAALAAITLSTSASAAIVVANGNGDFESTTISNLNTGLASFGLYHGSSTAIEGWTFTGGTSGGNFRWLFEAPIGTQWGPISGDYSLNLTQADSTFANTATTTVTGLTIGLVYDLAFDVAARSGAFGTVTVDVDGTQVGSFNQSIGTSFATQTYTFTASAATASIRFNYGSTLNGNGYVLDNVTVVPEPSAALLGGLGILGLLRRRR
jgi:hypothetical protein